MSRFCKDVFDKNYKATIGVDFEMERFEVLGVPFSLQLWVWCRPYSIHSKSSLNLRCWLSVAQMGHRRTREVQMHRFHILQRRSGWGIYTAVTWQNPNKDFRFRLFLLLFQLSSSHLMSLILALFLMWGKRIYIERLVLSSYSLCEVASFCLQAVAGRLAEGERPHSCPAVPGGHEERPECTSQ